MLSSNGFPRGENLRVDFEYRLSQYNYKCVKRKRKITITRTRWQPFFAERQDFRQ